MGTLLYQALSDHTAFLYLSGLDLREWLTGSKGKLHSQQQHGKSIVVLESPDQIVQQLSRITIEQHEVLQGNNIAILSKKCSKGEGFSIFFQLMDSENKSLLEPAK